MIYSKYDNETSIWLVLNSSFLEPVAWVPLKAGTVIVRTYVKVRFISLGITCLQSLTASISTNVWTSSRGDDCICWKHSLLSTGAVFYKTCFIGKTAVTLACPKTLYRCDISELTIYIEVELLKIIDGGDFVSYWPIDNCGLKETGELYKTIVLHKRSDITAQPGCDWPLKVFAVVYAVLTSLLCIRLRHGGFVAIWSHKCRQSYSVRKLWCSDNVQPQLGPRPTVYITPRWNA